MNKLFILLSIAGGIFSLPIANTVPAYSTTSVVTVVAAHIAVNNSVDNKKYDRKNCPVCKGKGWYISGDKITKVDCGYCEDKATQPNH
jgi:hypothetical protein